MPTEFTHLNVLGILTRRMPKMARHGDDHKISDLRSKMELVDKEIGPGM